MGSLDSPLETKITSTRIRADQLYSYAGSTTTPITVTPANNPDDSLPYGLASIADINNAGQILGTSADITLVRPSWATTWTTPTTPSTVNLPTGQASQPSQGRAIAPNGTVLAQLTNIGRGFVRSGSTSTLLSLPAGVVTGTAIGVDVNNTGSVIGTSGANIIFWATATTPSILLVNSPTLGYTPRFINNTGVIVGERFPIGTPSTANVGLWTSRNGGRVTQLTPPTGRTEPRLTGLSETNIAVGFWRDPANSRYRAFILEDGVWEDFSTRIAPGSSITSADQILAISEDGTIIGRNHLGGGTFQNWIATPE